MARPSKDSIPFNIRMQRVIYDDLCEFCEETGRTKTAAVEIAVQQYMENEKSIRGQSKSRSTRRSQHGQTKRS